jgi:SAM-dependent methyltransferase
MSSNPDISVDGSRAVRESLERPAIHDMWEGSYRTGPNERFYEMAFDELVEASGRPGQDRYLDAGCGVCAHSIRLAERGFEVDAVDFSSSALDGARKNVSAHGLEDRIRLAQSDVVSLPFATGQFPHVLCWGVLMHVPDVAGALAELARVTAPGGTILLNEINAASPEATLLRLLIPRVAKSTVSLRRTPAGFEHWTTTESGPLMWRHMDLPWLAREMARHGLRLETRRAAQLSELYTRLPGPLALPVHALNRLWFRHIRLPGPAVANVLVFRKR